MAKRKATSRREPEDWMSRIRESSHDVVLAGLASLTRAYAVGDKRAQADFRTLVAEGRRLEPELHDAARKVWSEWIAKPSKIMSLQPQSRLQSVFDERVLSVLVRFGVPSREEIADLRATVDRLLAREGLAARSKPTDEAIHRARAPAAPRRRRAATGPADRQSTRRRPARS